jgi:hypothetical protein
LTCLVGIPPENVDQVWPLIEERIEEACLTSRGKEKAFDIRRSAHHGEKQIWVVWDEETKDALAAVVTELVIYPRKKVCHIQICIGEERERWQHHIRIIENWAREKGCRGMSLVARPGWSRVLKQFGYDTTHHLVEKDFEDA